MLILNESPFSNRQTASNLTKNKKELNDSSVGCQWDWVPLIPEILIWFLSVKQNIPTNCDASLTLTADRTQSLLEQPHRHCDPSLTRHWWHGTDLAQPHRHCDPLPDPQLLTQHSPSPAQEQPHRHCDPLPDPSLLTRHSPCRNSLTDTNCKHKRHQLWPLPWPPTNCDPLPDPPLTTTPSLTLH